MQGRLDALGGALAAAGNELKLIESMGELNQNELTLAQRRLHVLEMMHHDLVAIHHASPGEVGQAFAVGGLRLPEVMRLMPSLVQRTLAGEKSDLAALRHELRENQQALFQDLALVRSTADHPLWTRAQKDEMATLFVSLRNMLDLLGLLARQTEEAGTPESGPLGNSQTQAARGRPVVPL